MELHRKTILGLVIGCAAIALFAGFGDTSGSRAKVVDPNATLIVAIDQPIGSLDPRVNHASLNARPLWNLFEGLVTKTWYRGDTQLKLVPALATTWTISKDRLTYTFNLRKGVKFSDGTPFNAAAMKFDFDTMFDSTSQFYYPAANSFDKGLVPTLASYAAPGPYTFRIVLNSPDGSLLDTLAVHQEFWAISPTAIQKYGNAGMGSNPVGTGPFSMASWNPATNVLVADRNDSYFRGPSKIKRLIMQTITDQSARTAALESRSVHIATNVLVDNATRWAGRKDIKLIIRQQPTIKSCGLNAESGPGTNKLFRQALSLAINRKRMNEVVYGGKGAVAHGFFPAASPAFDPKMPALQYNLAKAKQLMAQSGVPQGTKLTLETASGDANATKAFALLAEDLRAIGVNLTVNYTDGATYVKDLTTAVRPGLDGYCQTTQGTDTPSLFWYVWGRLGWPPGGYNSYHYLNPKLEAAFKRAQDAKDNDAWLKAISDGNKAATDDFAGMFLIEDVQGFGEAGNVVWTPAAARDYMYYSAKVLK